MQQQNSSNEMAPPTLLSINYQTPVMRTATRCSTTEPIQTTSGSDIQQGYTHIRTPFAKVVKNWGSLHHTKQLPHPQQLLKKKLRMFRQKCSFPLNMLNQC